MFKIMAESSVISRTAEHHDAHQIKLLLNQIGYVMDLDEVRNRIDAFGKESNQLIVAILNGSIIGVIAFACYEQLRLPGSCCHIDTLAIDEKHRGRGIGKFLYLEAERFSQKNGAISIELITANSRRQSGTHAFYESLGFKDEKFYDYSYFAKGFH